jgi:hypothetical protein
LAFEAEKDIFGASAELKEYCRRVIAADSSLRATYPDDALFLVLPRSLPDPFKPLTRAFIAQPTLSIAEKIEMPLEYEIDIWDEETKTEMAHIAKSRAKVSKCRRQHSDSDSKEGSSIKCHLCDGDHALRFCNHVNLGQKLLKRYIRKQKHLERPDKTVCSRSYTRMPSRQTHRYKATASLSDDNSKTSLNSTSSDDDDGILEVCNLSHDDISKVTPFSYLADTVASSHMFDQPSIFR